MRPIKFRAIAAGEGNPNAGKWCYGNFINCFITYFEKLETFDIYKVDPKNGEGYWCNGIDTDTLGQLTNCTTADGAEIYEGDKLVDDYLPGYYFVVYYDTEADAFRLYKRWPDGQILHYQEPLRISLLRYPNLRLAGTIHDDKLAAFNKQSKVKGGSQ